MAVGQRGQSFDVHDVAVGIAQAFDVNGPGFGPDGFGKGAGLVGVREGGRNAPGFQGMGQQVVGAAVEGFFRHDMLTRSDQIEQGATDRRRAAGRGQSRNAAFQGGHAFFESLLGGVGQAAVDVAGLAQIKAGLGVVTVAEHIGRGLIDGHGPGAAGRISLFLTGVNLQGFKVQGTGGAHGLAPKKAGLGRKSNAYILLNK